MDMSVKWTLHLNKLNVLKILWNRIFKLLCHAGVFNIQNTEYYELDNILSAVIQGLYSCSIFNVCKHFWFKSVSEYNSDSNHLSLCYNWLMSKWTNDVNCIVFVCAAFFNRTIMIAAYELYDSVVNIIFVYQHHLHHHVVILNINTCLHGKILVIICNFFLIHYANLQEHLRESEKEN